ncbi:MAG: Uma2 family endonuclease [Fimbriimonadaceae bacterium]|nr:Uma2 family endonuclease [Fimbriimonadaceae bacterium]
MALVVAPKLVTAAELLARSAEFGCCELIEGEVVAMAPAGAWHSGLTVRLVVALSNWSRPRRRGAVLESSVGYQVSHEPDTVLQPDVSWLSADRAHLARGTDYIAGPPDLAVEVVSPSQHRPEVIAKADRWLAAGAQVVWLVWPPRREVWVCRPDGEVVILQVGDSLTDPLLPEFALPLAELFEE